MLSSSGISASLAVFSKCSILYHIYVILLKNTFYRRRRGAKQLVCSCASVKVRTPDPTIGNLTSGIIISCISTRMYESVTVGWRGPAVELTWRYLQRVTSRYMRLLSGQLIPQGIQRKIKG